MGLATGKKEPKTGLEGKFSVFHSAAVALVDGGAGPEQYTDARVNDPVVRDLRSRADVSINESRIPDPGSRPATGSTP